MSEVRQKREVRLKSVSPAQRDGLSSVLCSLEYAMPENFPSVKSRYSIVRIPVFETAIIRYRGNREQRAAKLPSPYHRIRYLFNTLSAADADTIYKFFMLRKGAYEAFYLQNQEEAYRLKYWIANTAYVLNDIVRPTTANGRSYKCTTAGTTHSTTQPTWPTTFHGTVSDNGVVWTENSYLVRFENDILNMEAFFVSLYNLGEVSFVEVPA